MKTAALVLVLAAGCTAGDRALIGTCPVGETCSPATPGGLYFTGQVVAGVLFQGVTPTAVGGTQTFTLSYDQAGSSGPFDLPYTAVIDGDALTVMSTDGPEVTLAGAADGSAVLRILDDNGELYDRKEMDAFTALSASLSPADLEGAPQGDALAWPTGADTVAVTLMGNDDSFVPALPTTLVDSGLSLTLAGAEQSSWDTLEVDVAAGNYAIAATAPSLGAATLDFAIVAGADAIASPPGAPTNLVPEDGLDLCFLATNQGRVVVGLTWTFSGNDAVAVSHDPYGANCAWVTAATTSGTGIVVASAGGQQATVSLTIGPGTTTGTRSQSPAHATRTTSGERASAVTSMGR